jgi:hypothetical protein
MATFVLQAATIDRLKGWQQIREHGFPTRVLTSEFTGWVRISVRLANVVPDDQHALLATIITRVENPCSGKTTRGHVSMPAADD